MNKKGFAKIWTFLIIALSIAMIALLGTYLITGVNKSVNTNSRIQMITNLQASVDEMLMQNYGTNEKITLIVPNDVKKLCFIDFEKETLYLPSTVDQYEQKMQSIATTLLLEYNEGNIDYPENLYLFTKGDFELYKLKKITVETGGGIYCINAKTKLDLTLTSKGKTVLIK